MHRRTALLSSVAALFAACGGGGGSGGGTVDAFVAAAPPAPAPAATPPAPSAGTPAGMSPNIAMWGDSLTTPTAPNLQLLEPDRTVFNGGFVGWTSSQIAAVQLADTTHTNWITTFWYGHNNKQDPVGIKADIAASVAHLAPGNNRFIVMSIVNRSDEPRGTAAYDSIMRLNADLASTYGANYLDMREWLVSHYNPSLGQDVADFNADVPPTSLRSDEIHLRNEGSILVAQRVKLFIDEKGW